MSHNSGMNRRRATRIRHSAPAEIYFVSCNGQRLTFKGSVWDISAKGVSVKLNDNYWRDVAPKEKVTLVLQRARDVVRLDGVVVRVEEGVTGVSGLAIEFDKPRLDLIAHITSHVKLTVIVQENMAEVTDQRLRTLLSV